MIVGRKYKLIEMMGSGAFGAIAKGENIRTKEEVAVKIESVVASTKLLKNESRIYLLLNKEERTGGFPSIKWFGADKDFFYMVMELLGASLSSFKHEQYNDLSLPLEMVLKIGAQVVERLRTVHENGLVHRDIKPDNLLFGLGRTAQVVHLIDFGFCKAFITPEGHHVKKGETGSIVGTPNFVSINTHNYITNSRRDDIESLAYVLVYLFLPLKNWKKIFRDGLSNAELKRIKEMLPVCDAMPSQLREMLRYSREMQYDEKPDYDRLLRMLCCRVDTI